MKSFSVGLRRIIKITMPPQLIPFPSGWHTGLVLLYWKNHWLSVDVWECPVCVSSWSLCRVLQTEVLWGAGLCRDRSALSFASSPAKAVSFGYRMCLLSLNQLPWILPWYLGSNPLYFAFLYKISLGVFWKQLCNQGKNSGIVKPPNQNSTISFYHYCTRLWIPDAIFENITCHAIVCKFRNWRFKEWLRRKLKVHSFTHVLGGT